MVRIILLIALIIFAIPADSLAEKRVALVIGNSNYLNIPDLANPVNDANLVGKTLASLGFALSGGKSRLNLDKASLDAAVQQFGRDIQGADVALFYYAGHGVQIRGANFLVPVAANPSREADIDFQMLDSSLVVRQMDGSGARLKLLILDACRNNPFGGVGVRSASGGLAQMVAPEGTLISFATQPGNIALDGEGSNSPFTKAFAETIRRPGLDIFRAFNEVGLAVSESTAGQQQPWFQLSPIKGEFYFAGNEAGGKSNADAVDAPELSINNPRTAPQSETWISSIRKYFFGTEDPKRDGAGAPDMSAGDPPKENWFLSIYDDIDSYEGDIYPNGLQADSIEACQTLCEEEKECRIFTYARSLRSCFLKREDGVFTRASGKRTGFYHKSYSKVPEIYTIEVRWNLRNNMQLTFPTDRWETVSSVKECAELCEAGPCKAFSKYQKPTDKGNGNCELKEIFLDTALGSRGMFGTITGVPEPMLIRPSRTEPIVVNSINLARQ